MKIIFIGRYNDSDLLSGPEKVAKRLFEQISALNIETEFITFNFRENKRRRLTNLLFADITVQSEPCVKILGIIKIIQYLRKEKPDIVHIITFEKFLIPILLLKNIFKAKFIYTIHGLYKNERVNYFYKEKYSLRIKNMLLEYLLFKKSDQLFFLSKYSLELSKKYYLIDDKKTSILPNGVSLPEKKKNISFDFTNGIKIAFFEGSGKSLKRGLESLLKILDEFADTKICLSILLPTPKNYNLKNITISYSYYLPENKLYDFLSLQHVYIDSLEYSTFPLLALEAMANGLITIVSNKCGVADYITNGLNGFTFDLENPILINNILKDIISNKYDLIKLSSSAIETAQSLEWNNVACKYLNVYKSLG